MDTVLSQGEKMMSCLDRVLVAAPCPVSWDSMEGDERVRFCSGCSCNVYNISDMSKTEAESFLEKNGVSQCLRFFRRSDGTIMTDNCPRGLRAMRDRCRSSMKTVAGLVTALLAFVPAVRAQDADKESAPRVLGGKPMMHPPGAGKGNAAGSKDKPVLFLGDDCTKNKNLPSPQPRPVMGMIAAPADTAKSRANFAIMEAQNKAHAAEASGHFILAKTFYMEAIKAAKSPQADPKYLQILNGELAALQKKIGLDSDSKLK
ncbi:MAG: hypothetical protein K2X27_17670 [Candidatus Obscuribacterales bacterium]|nr:hypothetical protein [Candidatus Obscuribacterales bacterium]